jgi:hypothetical protein
VTRAVVNLSTIVCPTCSDRFTFAPGMKVVAERMVAAAASAGRATVPIKCAKCGTDAALNVATGVVEPRDATPRPLKCPVAGCAGFVARLPKVPPDHVGVDARAVEGPADVCGACGSVWADHAALLREIAASLVKYPYRAAWYSQDAGVITPSSATAANSVYDQVEREPADPASGFVRG